MRILCLVLALGTACSQRAGGGREEPKELSLVRFHPVRGADEGWIAGLEPGENRFGVNLLGITADGDHVLVYGSLVHQTRPYRSLLLTSNDGGLSWRETAPPYESSEITHAQLIGCTGWALSGWKQDGPGDLTLLGTGDCGKAWFTLSELPKTDDSGWPVALEFSDTFNGVVTLAYTAEDLERGYLRTQDGGRRWVEVLGRARRDEPGRIQHVFTAGSGAEWKLDADRGRYVVRRRGSPKELWTVTAVLPGWLRVEDAKFEPLVR